MASLEAEMLEFIRRGLDHHAQTCPLQPRAILLNPGNHELFGWDELWGIPVLPDDRVAPKRFRIDCDGSAFGIEAEVAELARATEPLEVPMPIGPREDEPTAAAPALGCADGRLEPLAAPLAANLPPTAPTPRYVEALSAPGQTRSMSSTR